MKKTSLYSVETDICLTLCSHDTANKEMTSLPWNNEVLVAFWDFFLSFPKWKYVNVRFSPFTWEKMVSSCSDYGENIKYVNSSNKGEKKRI